MEKKRDKNFVDINQIIEICFAANRIGFKKNLANKRKIGKTDSLLGNGLKRTNHPKLRYRKAVSKTKLHISDNDHTLIKPTR